MTEPKPIEKEDILEYDTGSPDEISRKMIEVFSIKAACEWYLKYLREYSKHPSHWNDDLEEIIRESHNSMDYFPEWLLKKAFKGVLE